MKPRNRVVATSVCFVMSLLSSHAIASNWNTFAQAYNVDSALFFFDADTVLKQGDTVTVTVEGGDEEASAAAMEKFLSENL